jgi:hypothetical protein
MPSVGFEPAIPAVKQLQTYALDRTATGIGPEYHNKLRYWRCVPSSVYIS